MPANFPVIVAILSLWALIAEIVYEFDLNDVTGRNIIFGGFNHT
jgi:hypothetical protein